MIWSLIYRTLNALRWGSGIGRDLTPAEVDKNFGDLEERVWTIETNPPDANGIASITVVGRQMTVWLQDATSLGPFTLPSAAFAWRGEWTFETGYFEFDLVMYGELGLYLVLQDHVSGEEFDPDEETTEGPIYQRIVGPFNMALPASVNAEAELTLTAAHANRYLLCTNTGGCVVTIPTHAEVPFDLWTEIHFRQSNLSDAVAFIGSTEDVVISGMDGFDDMTGGGGSLATLKKVADNAWYLWGRLEPGGTGTG